MISTLGVKGLVEQGERKRPQPPMSLVPCGNVHYLHLDIGLFFGKDLQFFQNVLFVYGLRVVYRPMQNLAIYFYPWPFEVCALDHPICNKNSLFSFINKHPYKMFSLEMNTIINKVFVKLLHNWKLLVINANFYCNNTRTNKMSFNYPTFF